MVHFVGRSGGAKEAGKAKADKVTRSTTSGCGYMEGWGEEKRTLRFVG